MFAISFDLAYAETQALHPKGLRQACRDIDRTLGRYGALPWFPTCVKDIKAFRVENSVRLYAVDERQQSMTTSHLARVNVGRLLAHCFVRPGSRHTKVAP
jgi:virulence-associated protein VapD